MFVPQQQSCPVPIADLLPARETIALFCNGNHMTVQILWAEPGAAGMLQQEWTGETVFAARDNTCLYVHFVSGSSATGQGTSSNTSVSAVEPMSGSWKGGYGGRFTGGQKGYGGKGGQGKWVPAGQASSGSAGPSNPASAGPEPFNPVSAGEERNFGPAFPLIQATIPFWDPAAVSYFQNKEIAWKSMSNLEEVVLRLCTGELTPTISRRWPEISNKVRTLVSNDQNCYTVVSKAMSAITRHNTTYLAAPAAYYDRNWQTGEQGHFPQGNFSNMGLIYQSQLKRVLVKHTQYEIQAGDQEMEFLAVFMFNAKGRFELAVRLEEIEESYPVSAGEAKGGHKKKLYKPEVLIRATQGQCDSGSKNSLHKQCKGGRCLGTHSHGARHIQTE